MVPYISAKRHQLTCSCHQEDLKPTVPWSALVQLCSIHYYKYNTSAPGFICTMAIDWGEIGWPIGMHYNSWVLFICRPCNALRFPRIPHLTDNFGNRQAGIFLSLAHQYDYHNLHTPFYLKTQNYTHNKVIYWVKLKFLWQYSCDY